MGKQCGSTEECNDDTSTSKARITTDEPMNKNVIGGADSGRAGGELMLMPFATRLAMV